MRQLFKMIIEDYNRHGQKILHPPFWALANYRWGKVVLNVKHEKLRWLLSKIYGANQFIIMITSNIQISCQAKIGEGFHIIHSGNIIIHPDVVIGDRCGIVCDVIIGTNMKSGAPVIGNDVFIGAGAKVLGPIKIGDNVTIAANSLVTVDVPYGATALGVPAKIFTIKR
jgi:serine O-acetyltransferase